MAGTFDERMKQLGQDIGSGDLKGSVVVDQVYARYQHEGLDLHHPRGGRARFLGAPLMEKAPYYLQHYADAVLDPENEWGRTAIRGDMENLAESDGVSTQAPVDFSNLRASGHPSVTDDGRLYYDRPPRQRRLSENEIRELKRRHPTGWVMIRGQHVFIGHPAQEPGA